MKSNVEVCYDQFITLIKKKFSHIFSDIQESGDWKLKVLTDDNIYVKINLEDAWKKYEKTKNLNVLLDFMNTQFDILIALNSKDKTFLDMKNDLIPSIRSDELLNKLKIGDEVIKKNVGKDLNLVVLLDQQRYTQIVNKRLYPNLPENDDEIINAAIDNLKERGWVKPTQVYNEPPFDLFIFEERKFNTHYQFFIKEWLENEIGNCYIAFPTHKISLVLRLKTNDWKDWIKCITFFNNTVKKTYNEEPYPLSQTIIKFENGNFEIL